mmetsp:Transcript_26207/g.51460  ORF Transcript_26207/g.51460 Transcript_26207/m.51460 type:complete len:114 (+) Transcript_26207:768-1109(+)
MFVCPSVSKGSAMIVRSFVRLLEGVSVLPPSFLLLGIRSMGGVSLLSSPPLNSLSARLPLSKFQDRDGQSDREIFSLLLSFLPSFIPAFVRRSDLSSWLCVYVSLVQKDARTR